MMSTDERQQALRKMDEAIMRFYTAAVNIGVHPFIEFAGVMTAYSKSCRRAHEADLDFTECSRHAGQELPVEDIEMSYLMEKLGCIFGGRLAETPRWERLSTAPKDGRQVILLPSPDATAWMSVRWAQGQWQEAATGTPLVLSATALWCEGPSIPAKACQAPATSLARAVDASRHAAPATAESACNG